MMCRLAGLLIGNINFSVSWMDVGVIVLVYVLIQLIRAVMVLLFYPLLARVGYGVSVSEALFVTWSGVRGAISVTLALVLLRSSVEVDGDGGGDGGGHRGISSADADRVFLLVGGVAALTLLINGTLAKTVLTKLHLANRTTEEQVHTFIDIDTH